MAIYESLLVRASLVLFLTRLNRQGRETIIGVGIGASCEVCEDTRGVVRLVEVDDDLEKFHVSSFPSQVI